MNLDDYILISYDKGFGWTNGPIWKFLFQVKHQGKIYRFAAGVFRFYCILRGRTSRVEKIKK